MAIRKIKMFIVSLLMIGLSANIFADTVDRDFKQSEQSFPVFFKSLHLLANKNNMDYNSLTSKQIEKISNSDVFREIYEDVGKEWRSKNPESMFYVDKDYLTTESTSFEICNTGYAFNISSIYLHEVICNDNQ